MSEAERGSQSAPAVLDLDPAGGPSGRDAPVSNATGPDRGFFQDEVTIRLPAHSIYVAVLRTAMTGVAARADFTVEDIEDLRIAVDEACALLLARAAAGAMLSAHVAASGDSVVAAVSTEVTDVTPPDTSSFGWLVLDALAGAVTTEYDGDVMTILLSRSRTS